MNKMMDIFKSYVDEDNGIFNIINNDGIITQMVNYKDWRNIDNDKIIYLSLDDYSLLIGTPYDQIPTSSIQTSKYYYFAWEVRRNTSGTSIIGLALKFESSNRRFNVTYYADITGGSFYMVDNTNYYESDIITINNKRYIPIIWNQFMFFNVIKSAIGNATNLIILRDALDDVGYFLKEEQSVYDWYNPTLDFDYLYEHSGDKYISRLVERLLDENEELPEANINKLAQIIKDKYVEKWNREYAVLIESEYNPIHNYEVNEETRRNSKIVSSGYSNTYGFNTVSEDGVPSEKSGATTEGNINDNYETHSRGGNIGVTTTQKLVEEELELRKHVIYDMIMNDVDVVLCNAIYDIER